ncbi:MAG TPA: 4'-phosphopantetheinyl transferase superfamily protein [Polyangia bacterium]|jgi:4'-phosphopantetheinyl transferase|nr:4'-phosphopantetheinyl transferase superfamily protein [Polyangia bacterium]
MTEELLRLGADDVHVWSLSLDLPEAELRRLGSVISAEEAARAERFVFTPDRQRYVAAHGLLRLVLAGYLGTSPDAVAFRQDSDGKPRLAESERLRFNLSHSGFLGLLAVSAQREVGVDIEEIRNVDDMENLAETCFSPVERTALAAVPAAQRRWAFFAGWTRKEAFLKVLGQGLSRPLDSFDVSLAPSEPARLLRVEGAPGAPESYAVRSLEPAPGYLGALVVDGPQVTIHWRALSALSAGPGLTRSRHHVE